MAARPRLMCIATHHKGGTIWIKRVVKALSREMGIPWHGIWSDKRMNRVPDTGRAFLCNWAGYFPQALWDRGDAAFLHVIRDPRDLLLSGCHYHHTAPVEGEGFLHRPREALGGLTYQQHLNALPTPEDKLLFEMEAKHAQTLAEMRAWPYDDPRSVELRYEDLIEDSDCLLIEAALHRLGFDAAERRAGVAVFWQNSLFGGLADSRSRTGRLNTHIQSGQGARWRRELPRSVGAAYADAFGDDLIALGYEKDHAWVDTLPESYGGPALPVAAAPAPAPRPRAIRARPAEAGDSPEHLRNYGFNPDIVIDVGVDTGTPFLYEAFPKARFLLVDPRAESRDAVAGIAPANHVFHCVALGAAAGTATLRIPVTKKGPAGAMAGIRARTGPMARNLQGEETREVPVVTLDSLTAGAPGRFGLKIDTEGHELDVLRGGAETLKRCDFVIVELSVTPRFAGIAPPSALIALLAEAGLELRDILRRTGDGKGGAAPRLFDALFARWEGAP